MFKGFLEAVVGAPKWVWLLLAYLIFVGVRFLSDRIVFLPTLLVLPIIFTAIKASGCPLSLVRNFSIILVAALVVWAYNNKIHVQPVGQNFWATIPGTPMYLMIFLLIFATRFAAEAMQVINPALYAKYGFVEYYLTAVYTGMLWGRVLAIFQSYLMGL